MKNLKLDENNKGEKFPFSKKNYILLIISVIIILIGYFVMSGGGSDDPKIFNPEIFGFRVLILAPIIVSLGYGLVVYAIMKK